MEENKVEEIPHNMAAWDRVLRLVIGLALFSAGFLGLVAEPIAGSLRLASIVPLAMAGFGWCPVLQAFGISSRKPSPADQGRGPYGQVVRVNAGR